MDETARKELWQQFGAAIDMLENAMAACPEKLWGDQSRYHQFWYMVYHTLFWLDLYLSESFEGFAPPKPFTMVEMDPAGVMPERVYTKEELLNYLNHCREKCRTKIEGLTEEKARQRFRLERMDYSIAELMLYNMRHVQHHTAQLNLLLRLEIDSAPRWVGRTQR